ncbi:hypothetical protein Tco_1125505 [Tanacetum coccineum]|uniref:Uncharacterized protein n=1 Tax=Tanacetum coccineum TaxID=301880 RepID=A0ABQ5J960_9ASTR
MPPRKRVCFTAPTRRFEVGESSTAVAAAGQTGHTLARRVDYEFIDTLDASIRAFEGRVMTTDAQDDRAFLRAQISLLTRERRYFRSMASSYGREVVYARQAWSRSEYRSTALETSIRTLEAQKMVPKKTTTPMIDAAIKQLIAQGIADALAEYEATRNSGNGDDNHDSGSGRKTKRY